MNEYFFLLQNYLFDLFTSIFFNIVFIKLIIGLVFKTFQKPEIKTFFEILNNDDFERGCQWVHVK